MLERCLSGHLLLKICFAVKILSLHETDTLGQRALQKDQIAGEVLFLVDFDERADLDILTLGLFEMYRALWTAVDSGIILFVVFLAPLIIFEGILDHGDTDNGQQGQESENPVVLVSKRREKLHYHDDQEVDIGHF